MQTRKAHRAAILSLAASMTLGVACSEPLSKREQSGLIGGGLGAVGGAVIGSTTGHAGTGALIGAPIGLLAGALTSRRADW